MYERLEGYEGWFGSPIAVVIDRPTETGEWTSTCTWRTDARTVTSSVRSAWGGSRHDGAESGAKRHDGPESCALARFDDAFRQ